MNEIESCALKKKKIMRKNCPLRNVVYKMLKAECYCDKYPHYLQPSSWQVTSQPENIINQAAEHWSAQSHHSTAESNIATQHRVALQLNRE